MASRPWRLCLSLLIFLLFICSHAFASPVSPRSTCTGPPTPSATAGAPFWMESITHQGSAPYSGNSSYAVFRNVKDYGAAGDGVTDDTDAINSAISSGGRCGEGCNSSTTTPAVVFFPQGTYLVSSPLIAYYYTQLIGDARSPPTIKASSSFSGIAVIDADPYIDGGDGAEWYTNQNNFFRSVRNFIIDVTDVPIGNTGTGIHWQVAQATSLVNIVFEMSTDSDTDQQGIWMENGSGGFMGDMVFNGGKYGMWMGNQQFTVRNVTINDAITAIYLLWNWGWTFQDVQINDCTTVGFDLATGGLTEATQSVGALAIIDATVSNTPIFLRISDDSSTSLAGSLVLNNIALSSVSTAAVSATDGTVILDGGSTTIDTWVQGNVYSGTDSSYTYQQASTSSLYKPGVLLDSTGKIVGKGHPQYADYAVDQFVSAKNQGATGDGSTDDTEALQTWLDTYSGCNILFLDAGVYIVTSTLTIPAGTQLVGEAWSVISGSGSAFEDATNPQVVVQVGDEGSQGVTEITDVIFSTVGPSAGAIIVEWNVAEPDDTQAGAGMWDSHIRCVLSLLLGTNLDPETCPEGTTSDSCMAAFLALHLTSGSTAYLEGTWVWLADHYLDGDGYTMISLFSGRGILSESAGPVWMIGTGETEHHVLYQYNLQGAQNHYMGLIQTETPYFQPSPAAPSPFSVESAYEDPELSSSQTSAWALYINGSSDILVYGAGLYSFYSDFSQNCLDSYDCQPQIANVVSSTSSNITIVSLSTVASTSMLSVDETGVISATDNINGFAETVTFWTL
ncbi:glycoside hydrolase family 55 protein [Fistulina hepatica ATCC 64428]|nr:glycoside hydrolase family 55 protein [Fistulina hepatica ATCC 64428]